MKEITMKLYPNNRRKRSRIWIFLLASAATLLLLSYALQRQSYNDSENNSGGTPQTAADVPADDVIDTPPDSPADTSTDGGTDTLSDTASGKNADRTADIDTAPNSMSDRTSHENEKIKESKEEEETEAMTKHPGRVTYCEGFFYEPLTDELIQRIQGISYHENTNITYEDLCYLNVLYCDFDNNTRTGEIICNRLIAEDLLEIFKALYDASYQIEKIRLVDEYQADDDLSCADNNTSCFNYRVVAGSDTLSKHALGMAIDINPFYNPYITYPDGNKRISPAGSEIYEDREGGYDHMILKDDLCYRLFTEHGFTWGGEWKSIKDYQHFQKVIKS